jgi:CheY-like chemotaxis protein
MKRSNKMKELSILHIDDDPVFRSGFQQVFDKLGFKVRSSHTQDVLKSLVPGEDFVAVVADSCVYDLGEQARELRGRFLFVRLSASEADRVANVDKPDLAVLKGSPDWCKSIQNAITEFSNSETRLKQDAITDVRWAMAQARSGQFAKYTSGYIAILGKEVVGTGNDEESLREMVAKQKSVLPGRVIVQYRGGAA